MSTILTCPRCGGKYGHAHTHDHPYRTGEYDARFANCRTCHGVGAITCEMCEGYGRVYREEDGSIIGPAVTEVTELAARRGFGAHPQAPRKAKR
jgi:DnaJ-class molecular chaperone